MVDLGSEAEKFSLPAEGSEKYKEIAGTLPSEEGMAERAGNAIKANLKIILVIAVIIIAGSAIFFLMPRSASLSIEVSELDSLGSAIKSATVSITGEDGKSVVQDKFTDDLGYVKFSSVPAGRDLTLTITPLGMGFNRYRKNIRLEPDEEMSLQVEMEKTNVLSPEKGDYEFTLAPGCSHTLDVVVNNLDSAEIATELVADEGLAKMMKSGGEKAVPSGGTETLTANFLIEQDAPQEIAGTLRLKYTNRKINVKIRRTDKKPKLSVDFVNSDAKDIKTSVLELPAIRKSTVKVRNTASSGAMALTAVKVLVKGEFAPWAQLDTSSVEEANANRGIQPGSEVLIPMTVTIPQGTAANPYLGELSVSSSCEAKSIPLSAEIEQDAA